VSALATINNRERRSHVPLSKKLKGANVSLLPLMIGKASDIFNANPAAVVSQNGTSVYVFAARTNPSLCVVNGIHEMDCGNVYYAHFTP
jgi:hypothetical protein